MKIIIALLVAALAVLGFGEAQSNHGIWGRVLANDSQIYSEHVKLNSIWLLEREYDVTFPPKGVINDRWITSIRAYDAKTNGNGANVTIVSGGVNHDNVHLHFHSKRGHGIDFDVQIFTAPCHVVWRK